MLAARPNPAQGQGVVPADKAVNGLKVAVVTLLLLHLQGGDHFVDTLGISSQFDGLAKVLG